MASVFLVTFVGSVISSLVIDAWLKMFFTNPIVSFLISHLILMFLSTWSKEQIIWWTLTILHGLAHIIHPAFFGYVENPHYTPLPDYTIHAIQCLCILFYHGKKARSFAITSSLAMIVAGMTAHFEQKFLETWAWIFMSFGGVLGAHYHMLLLNLKRKDPDVYYSGWLIWSLPYLGYLFPAIIPTWDYLMNRIGLFRVWYLAYFFAITVYNDSPAIVCGPQPKMNGPHTIAHA